MTNQARRQSASSWSCIHGFVDRGPSMGGRREGGERDRLLSGKRDRNKIVLEERSPTGQE
jgi:hypothetical protein